MLVLPRKDRHWRLATDASIVAMGALCQYDDDNIEHPIGYWYFGNVILERALAMYTYIVMYTTHR